MFLFTSPLYTLLVLFLQCVLLGSVCMCMQLPPHFYLHTTHGRVLCAISYPCLVTIFPLVPFCSSIFIFVPSLFIPLPGLCNLYIYLCLVTALCCVCYFLLHFFYFILHGFTTCLGFAQFTIFTNLLQLIAYLYFTVLYHIPFYYFTLLLPVGWFSCSPFLYSSYHHFYFSF